MGPSLHSRTVTIALEAPTTEPAELERLFDSLERVLADQGLTPADVVRNRLIAASRPARDRASAFRFARLSGPARCATSSYIDEQRFPGGDGVLIETLAVAGAGDGKMVEEYEPLQPPCRFVAAAGVVYLAGLTSTASGWEDQVAEIRQRVDETLEVAERRLGAAIRPTALGLWVHRSVAADAIAGLPGTLGLDGLPLTIERCDGYSRPGKLLEVEIDAVASG
jgi:hypothetical protein